MTDTAKEVAINKREVWLRKRHKGTNGDWSFKDYYFSFTDSTEVLAHINELYVPQCRLDNGEIISESLIMMTFSKHGLWRNVTSIAREHHKKSLCLASA